MQLGRIPARGVATCKSRYSRGKVADFETLRRRMSQKEKKIDRALLNSSRVFEGTEFA
jgi:hypothetical protein